MTLRELSRRCEIDVGYLSRFERGMQTMPSPSRARIAVEIGRYQAERVA